MSKVLVIAPSDYFMTSMYSNAFQYAGANIVVSPYDINVRSEGRVIIALLLLTLGNHHSACCSYRSCFKALLKIVIVWMFSGHTARISSRVVMMPGSKVCNSCTCLNVNRPISIQISFGNIIILLCQSCCYCISIILVFLCQAQPYDCLVFRPRNLHSRTTATKLQTICCSYLHAIWKLDEECVWSFYFELLAGEKRCGRGGTIWLASFQ